MCKGPEAEDPEVQGQKASVAGKGWEEEDVGSGKAVCLTQSRGRSVDFILSAFQSYGFNEDFSAAVGAADGREQEVAHSILVLPT